MSPQNTSVIGGFIKIERLNASDSTWHDITAEILGYGIGAPSQSGNGQSAASCDVAANDPSPNAILRLQRLHDSGQVNATTANCTPKTGASKYDYWPNTLFDGREGWPRDTLRPAPTSRSAASCTTSPSTRPTWRNGSRTPRRTTPRAIPATCRSPTTAATASTSRIAATTATRTSKETAEYGWEDFVNPLSATGTPNGVLDAGEDLNANTMLETYGGRYNCNGVLQHARQRRHHLRRRDLHLVLSGGSRADERHGDRR